MTELDLVEFWKRQNRERCRQGSNASLIRVTAVDGETNDPLVGTTVIAIEVGENLSPTFLSGDIIVFWENGEHTCLDTLEFDVVVEDLYKVEYF